MITFVNAGASSATNGSAPTPGLPASLSPGDVMVCAFYSRENVDGTVSISAGWNQIVNDRSSGGLLAAWWRVYQSGDAAPTLTVTNHATGASGDSAIAQIAAWRGCDQSAPLDVTGAVSTNASAQNIGAISGLSLAADDVVIVAGGKRDDWTSVATLSGDSLTWAEIGEPDTTSGADAGLVWDYAINGGSGTTVTSKTFTVTGGASAEGKGVMFTLNVAPPAQTVSGVGAVGTAEAFGTAKLNFTVRNAGAIASAEAFGAASVFPDQVISAAGAIGTAEAFGAAKLNLTVRSAGGIASGEALGTPTAKFTLKAVGAIASSEALGNPKLSFTVRNAGAIGSSETFGAATVTTGGGQSVSAAGAISSAEVFGSAAVTVAGAELLVLAEPRGWPRRGRPQRVGAWGIESSEAFGFARVVARRPSLMPAIRRPPPPDQACAIPAIESREEFGMPALVRRPSARQLQDEMEVLFEL